MLLKLFHKIEREGMLPNSFNEASVTLIPKSDKNTMRIKKNTNYRPIFLMDIDEKILNEILANQIHQPLNRSYTMIYSRHARMVSIC
jgi:hypothetical protein